MVPSTDILIVDDEVGIRELLSEILQDEGYRVSLAENATEARTYRSKQLPARALQQTDAPWLALTSGSRLAGNPLAVLDEARDGTLYCCEIGQYAKAEQKGLAFLLPKLERANVTLVCTSA